ncbi:nodulation protein NfeD [Bdellovibrio bacteriovorus]|uniref:NfeD family protein n=1 Tax=Bdellovibrio bacteriovorus TaxID=959 RepID=UPI0035A5B89E
MKKLALIFFLLFSVGASAQAACTLAVTINEAITASTSDYLARAEKKSGRKQVRIFVRSYEHTGRKSAEHTPDRRAHPGFENSLSLFDHSQWRPRRQRRRAIILQACHVNGGLVATNIGAATPILGTGEKTPEDLRKKIVNDTVSWLEGVTKLRGRNLEFSKEIVTEAKSLSSEQAHKEKALDILANNELDFLRQAQGRVVLTEERKETTVKVDALQEFAPDLRYKVLSFVADPEFAYLLFMGSLALLYVEITHPGMIAPGVIGGIGLVLSLIAFHKLEVVWGGLALILLGIAFLVLEIFLPSFGILGAGGLISIFVGSLFLFDAQSTGYTLPLPLIISVVGLIGAFFLGLGYLAVKTIRFKSSDVDSDLKRTDGVVTSVENNGHSGQILIMGETWKFVSEDSLRVNDTVSVTGRQGLTVNVKKVK